MVQSYVHDADDGTSVLLRWNCAFVIPFQSSSPVGGSAGECHIQLLARHVRSVARHCHDHILPPLDNRHRMVDMCIYL